jgi:hypothetical protein
MFLPFSSTPTIPSLPVYRQVAHGAKSKVSTTVVPEPSFNVPLGLLAISGLSAYEGITPLAGITGLLGVFLTIQATRVK